MKQWHTPRIAAQLALLPERADALVLVGRRSVAKLLALAAALEKLPPP